MTDVRVLVVYADDGRAVSDRRVSDDLATMQELVGGYIEARNGSTWHAYVDEEGQIKRLVENRRAEMLLTMLDAPAYVFGTAVFVGHNDRGDECDVPTRVIEAALTLFGARNVRLKP